MGPGPVTRPHCFHENKRLVWTHLAASGEMLNGPRQLRFQCRDCGKLLAQAVAHVRARPDTPQVDEQFLREWISYDRQRWSAASAGTRVPGICLLSSRALG